VSYQARVTAQCNEERVGHHQTRTRQIHGLMCRRVRGGIRDRQAGQQAGRQAGTKQGSDQAGAGDTPDSAWRAACAASARKNCQKARRRGATSSFDSASAACKYAVGSGA
jgi:hypothetical protein